MQIIAAKLAAQQHPRWESRWTFVATGGALAVGLGNFWRLGWAANEYGGGLYLLTYLAGLALVAFPLLVGELMIGRRGRGSPVFSILHLQGEARFARAWYGVAPIAAVAAVLLAAVAVVTGSWLLLQAVALGNGSLTAASVELVAQRFPANALDLDTARQWMLWFAGGCLLLLAVSNIGQLGVVMRILMVLLLVLSGAALYGAMQVGFGFEALSRLLAFRPDDFGWVAIAHASVQSLLTLGIGLMVLTAYGSYTPEGKSLIWQAGGVVVLDLVLALLGGLVLLSVLAPHNIQPGGGYALLFVSLPYVFANINFGDIVGGLYFSVLVAVTATTVIALLEPAIAWLVERWLLPRFAAAVLLALPLLALADLVLRGLMLGDAMALQGMLPSEWIELIATGFIIPGVALVTALALGRRVPFALSRKEFSGFDFPFFWVWYPVMRYIVPPAVLLIFTAGLWLFFR